MMRQVFSYQAFARYYRATPDSEEDADTCSLSLLE